MYTLLKFRIGIWLGVPLIFGVSGNAQNASAPLPQVIQFNRDIRPILSDKCFTCHGPDKSHRTTVFHFDVEETVKQDLGNGHFVIVPGDLDKSAIVQRITAPDTRRRMPPASTGRTLSEREIAMLKKWIEQGAKWEKHWSFVPPQRPAVPSVANSFQRWTRLYSKLSQSLSKFFLGPEVQGQCITWTLQAGFIIAIWTPQMTIDHYLFVDATGAEYNLNVNTYGVWSSQEGVYVSYEGWSGILHFPDGSLWAMNSYSVAGEPDSGSVTMWRTE
jgi:hypothetical protein